MTTVLIGNLNFALKGHPRTKNIRFFELDEWI